MKYRAKKRKEAFTSLVKLHFAKKAGHLGSSLSCLDILGVLYFDHIKTGEYVILSKGHAASALYTILNLKEMLSTSQINTFHADSGTYLGAHPSYGLTSSIPFTTGSLGHGLSLAAGIAHGNILRGRSDIFTFCVLSDGECNEGQTWEAAQYATAKNISNLICVIDRNKWQAFGKTKDILGDRASRRLWEAFGFVTGEVEGHKPKEIQKALIKLRNGPSKSPKILICNTIKGYGMGILEDKVESHYLPINSAAKDEILTFIKSMA